MSGQAKVEIAIETRSGGKVARVTIDNVAKLNALSSPVMEAFVAAVEKCGARLVRELYQAFPLGPNSCS